ncbi:hypothetical protein [Actinoplanes xinjiangensis]|nr:hypothetical protein [Actinoplanes xinjiangensis]
MPDQIGDLLMSLWRNVRSETAGAWRSLCYDLGWRPEPGAGAGPDVTSTGMNTFPGSLVDLPAEPRVDEARPPRRFVTVAAFCALAMCGAAGSYLVATTAFAGRMTDTPVAAPAVAAAPVPPRFENPAPTATATGDSAGMGRTPRKPHTTAPAPLPPVVTTTTRIVVPPPPTREKTQPAAPVTGSPECDCDTPPVPTPTVPEPSASVSASPSSSADPSPSGPVGPSPGGGAWMPRSDGHHHRLPW